MMERSLNMACSLAQNTPCSNDLFMPCSLGGDMHPTFKRLLEMAGDLKQTQLANALNESEQTITNWKTRGVPAKKHVPIAKKLGGDPMYLAFGGPSDQPAKKNTERRLALIQQAAFSEDEKTLLDGYRLAKGEVKEIMLSIAEREIANFGRRSGEANL